MDAVRFDALTRTISRRAGFGLLVAAGIAAATPGWTGAKKHKKKGCKSACPACKRCVKGACRPQPANTPCPGGRCQGGRCVQSASPPPPPGPSCSDGVRNGGETDVDCGGPACPPCAVGRVCARNTDCGTARCGDALGQGNTCRSCTNDGVCGSDANGGCRCDRETGACRSDVSPTTFVDSCTVCPRGTICLTFFEGLACIPLCGG